MKVESGPPSRVGAAFPARQCLEGGFWGPGGESWGSWAAPLARTGEGTRAPHSLSGPQPLPLGAAWQGRPRVWPLGEQWVPREPAPAEVVGKPFLPPSGCGLGPRSGICVHWASPANSFLVCFCLDLNTHTQILKLPTKTHPHFNTHIHILKPPWFNWCFSLWLMAALRPDGRQWLRSCCCLP